jgi:predicted site-specific integrase-resolvase
MSNLLNLKQAMDYLSVSKSTLHRWDREDKLKPIKTSGGHRRYVVEELDKFIGKLSIGKAEFGEVVVAIYSRCSTADQKAHGDLDRQSLRNTEYCIKKKYKIEHIIKDIGSGLNDKRIGFIKLCDLVTDRKINKVIIENKDRLTRFQFNLIERFFSSYGVEIEISNKKELTQEDELINDFMMLMASFTGRIYSKRAQENRKKRKLKDIK